MMIPPHVVLVASLGGTIQLVQIGRNIRKGFIGKIKNITRLADLEHN